MSTQTNIRRSIVYLLFLTNVTEPIYLLRMPSRILGRNMKCCNQHNDNQTNLIKKNHYPPAFRRDMTHLYLGNVQGTPSHPDERDTFEGQMDVSQPGLMATPPAPSQEVEDHVASPEEQKALACAKLPCQKEDHNGLVCACNFKSGRVVSFKNECDLRKHNCRFDTDFRIILNDVCPWQYESRHDIDKFDYSNPSYYN